MNNSIKITIMTVLGITSATTITVLKVQPISAFAGPSCSGCAKDFAPGTEAKSPGDAQNVAPGELAKAPPVPCQNCAKDFAPGQEKIITK
jgi:hypothetical protein